MSRISIPAFTPTAVPERELLARTVGRTEVIDRMLARLRAAAETENRPHVLVVGSRGSGKTHLLRAVSHLARETPELAERLQFVMLPEESHEIVSYADLLYAVVEHLAGQSAAGGGEIVRKGREARGDESQLQRLILGTLAGRVLVLVAENLDRLLSDFGAGGQARFRSFVETSGAVLLFASTPLLSRDLSDHAMPWYGAFHPEHLEELDLDEGTELLKRLAAASPDGEKLVAFLDTDEGRGRLAAMRQLTGGSPRMWIVLAGCMTVENLDALVPVVRALLDELVPYYQERLGSLPGNERKLVVELCRTTEIDADGQVRSVASGLRNVSELAASAGLDRQVVATTLGRLERNGWVRRVKVPGTDGRTSWYELREPMLRHHLQYRDTRGSLLDVIVGFLRAWYAPWEQRLRLAAVEAGSIAERYLSSVVKGDGMALPSDALWAHGDVDDLLIGARASIDGMDSATEAASTHSRLAAIVAEIAALAARDGRHTAAEAAKARLNTVPQESRDIAQIAIQAVLNAGADDDLPVRDKASAGLTAGASASQTAPIRDRVAVGLLAAGWRVRTGDERSGIHEMHALAELIPDNEPALRLTVESALAAAAWRAGSDEAQAMLVRVSEAQAGLLGPNHPDTLVTRERHADGLERHGDPAGAASLFDDLVPAYASVFGDREPRTFRVRAAHARAHARAGGHEVALGLFERLVASAETTLAGHDEQLLSARLWVARETAVTAGAQAALVLERELVRDAIAGLGPAAPITVEVRYLYARHLVDCARHAEAADVLAALAVDLEALLGSRDELTVRVRLAEANAHAHAGRRERALTILSGGPAGHEIASDIGSRAEIDAARLLTLAALGRYAAVIAIGDQVVSDADEAFGSGDHRTRTIAAARSYAYANLGHFAPAVRSALDLYVREVAAGVAAEGSGASFLLTRLAMEAQLDAWGFGTADETLQAARSAVLEIAPQIAIAGWLRHTLTVPPTQIGAAIEHIRLENNSSPQATELMAVGLALTAASGLVPTDQTRVWLRNWPESVRSMISELSTEDIVVALIDVRDGHQDTLAKLPLELRDVIEAALPVVRQLDERFARP
jgi:energy-coupling factor transporter ATP-binding protein EcfA2